MSDAPSPARFTARDLALRCEVSERTVRYYVEEGLLPPPHGRGRGAHFGPDHLTRLRLIRAMQQTGADLETIRAYLEALERELKDRKASFEEALAVWAGRAEQAGWRDHFRRIWSPPEALHRYRIAPGVELLVEPRATPAPERMKALLRQLREAFAEEEEEE